MKNKYNKLTCLFGHHDYSKRLTMDNRGRPIHLCQICKSSAYKKYLDDDEVWYDYDGNGNMIHERWNNGRERWYKYDGGNRNIYFKYSDGTERWKANNGQWVDKKPRNWKYEKYLQ